MSGATLIQVPYHLGRKGVVLGAGPEPLAKAIGGDSIVVERAEPLTNEISATFDVIRQTRTAVREIRVPRSVISSAPASGERRQTQAAAVIRAAR